MSRVVLSFHIACVSKLNYATVDDNYAVELFPSFLCYTNIYPCLLKGIIRTSKSNEEKVRIDVSLLKICVH